MRCGAGAGPPGRLGFRKADALLNEVRALPGSDRPVSACQFPVGPDRRACWGGWREVRDELKRVRDRRQDQDYQGLSVPVAEVNECARWRGTLEQKRGQHEHLLQQVAKLEGMEKNARSEDFAVQVRGWLQETTEKLRRTAESIAELEERIRVTVKKLGGHGAGARAGGGGTTPPGPASEPENESRPGGTQDGSPGPPESGS
jgi:hypothetical protein